MASPPPVDELIERFGARPLPFVLDSSLSNDGLGEWSFFGADPFLVFEGQDGAYVERQASNCSTSGDADDAVRLTGILKRGHVVTFAARASGIRNPAEAGDMQSDSYNEYKYFIVRAFD